MGGTGADLTVSVKAWDTHAVVRPEGELDLSTTPILQQAICDAAGRSRRIRLDLSDLTFTDAAGLTVLVRAKQKLGERLTIAHPVGTVRRVLALTLLDRALRVEGTDEPDGCHPQG